MFFQIDFNYPNIKKMEEGCATIVYGETILYFTHDEIVDLFIKSLEKPFQERTYFCAYLSNENEFSLNFSEN